MRLALKHQIILAPATILLLMTLLLSFLQYTYWDLSVKRQEARRLGTVFIALAEADLATQRMQGFAQHLGRDPYLEVGSLAEVTELYRYLSAALQRITELLPLPDQTLALLKQAQYDLNPENGLDAQRILDAVALLRPQLSTLAEASQNQRQKLRGVHNQDIDELVARTAFVSIVVLGTAILVGIFLSLYFARRILRRIQSLSESAGRIAAGDLSPPTPPPKVRDELDGLTLSINRMTERLIRVVGTEKLLEGAEEERRRIAMDIHDQTLSDLSAIRRDLEGIDCPGAPALAEDLQRAMANLREVMDDLHPQTLDILGLGAALQSHLESHLAKGTLPRYHLYSAPEVETAGLSRLALLSLYRIAVEAIHNVIKHAGASRYEVNLDRRGDTVVLSVEDNGTGFEPAERFGRGGRGLYNIRERARGIGATVAWSPSRFSTGTRFELTLPLEGEKETR
ncbi:sensor histidine kinase, HAMP domain-containing [Desulfuromonas soudanensis]|uniref:histidine kinase n=1 Tax=Desulfuromonas soudanensis TaxID=1603606 RepID=A0A0M4CUH5_9BACT|nr:HAMP domain-containing protein [Desulfuromonas soudanensis]ALC15166.1 sensor histidine kinase, HAMP domain-containing [Desulfuromonas soudanensis]